MPHHPAPSIVPEAIDGRAFEDGADSIRILISGAQTGEDYSALEWVVAPLPLEAQTSFGPHRHGLYEETFLVLKGTLAFLLKDQVSELAAGDFVRVPKKTRHGYVNRSGAPVHLLVTFRPAGVEELFYRHRSDQTVVPSLEEFLDEAGRAHASTYEMGHDQAS
jgi:quercetin dioxygenase-like cupin family protein